MSDWTPTGRQSSALISDIETNVGPEAQVTRPVRHFARFRTARRLASPPTRYPPPRPGPAPLHMFVARCPGRGLHWASRALREGATGRGTPHGNLMRGLPPTDAHDTHFPRPLRV